MFLNSRVFYIRIKRIIDFFVGIILLLLTLPLILICILIIYLQDRKSPIFIQKRVGKNQKVFKLLKLRSMRKELGNKTKGDGDLLSNKKETLEEARLRFITTKINDKRITKFGSFIRAFHIDELTQLIHLITGEMSLVGPRPDVIVQQADYSIEEWSIRNSVSPGLTSLAIVRQARNTKERIFLDCFYVKNISFLLDLKIICLTFKKLIFKRSF